MNIALLDTAREAPKDLRLRRLTPAGKAHFFGYYDRCPWSPKGENLLGLSVADDRSAPGPDSVAEIVVIDAEGTEPQRCVGRTTAWNFQQGSMQHWLSDEELIHNDRRDGRFVGVVRRTSGEELAVLPRPIYSVAPDSRTALTLNFSRLARTRPGYGYAGVEDATAGHLTPGDDGVWKMDLHSGKSELLLSIADLAAFEPQRGMAGAEHWCNHLTYSPSGRSFVFLHRWRTRPRGEPAPMAVATPARRRSGVIKMARRTLGMAYQRLTGRRFSGHQTRMLVADADGRNLRCIVAEGMVSHFCWRGETQLLAWSRHSATDGYWLFDVETGTAELIGAGILGRDGHCTYSPDQRWLLTDTYPDDDGLQTLLLYDMVEARRVDLRRFASVDALRGEIRCDLHPRFDRTGTRVCFDSAHEGARQMYTMDVSEIIAC